MKRNAPCAGSYPTSPAAPATQVSGATNMSASTRNVPRIATTRIQFRISSVRSMRRPKSRMATHSTNVPTPKACTSPAFSGPARSRNTRKNTAPAAVPAQAGHPSCRKYSSA